MQGKKYFVLDVTTLLKWNRSPVGIIRTQLEFVNYLLSEFSDVVYFEFNDAKDNLSQVADLDVKRKVEQLLNFKNLPIVHSTQSIVKKNDINYHVFFKKIAHIYKHEGLGALFVKFCKKQCPPTIKHYAKIILLRLSALSYFSKNKSTPEASLANVFFIPEVYQASQLDVPFLNNNAIVISMGLDWDYSNYPLLFWLKKKIGFEFVGSFYDGIPIVNPELVQSYYFSQRFFSHFYYLVNLSDRVFCISNFSKNQIIEICNQHCMQDVPLLKTIHLGDSVFKNPTQKSFASRKHKKNYVLYVSTIESRKNHILLLKVWQKLQREKFVDLPDLVLVGMMGWGIEELLSFYKSDIDLQEVVHFYHDVDDDELVNFYQMSRFTVFPSFVEGWGLGAVESMLYGKPCIVSNCEALLEATQGLMPALSPSDIEGWTEMIRQFSADANLVDAHKNKIKENFKSRTWEAFSADFARFAWGDE